MRKLVYYNCPDCGVKMRSAQYYDIGKCEKCSGRLSVYLRKYSCAACHKEISYSVKYKYGGFCRECFKKKEKGEESSGKVEVKKESYTGNVCGNCLDWERLNSDYGGCRSEEFIKRRLHESLHTHAITKACGYYQERRRNE